MTVEAYPRRKELTLVPCLGEWRRLPVLGVKWLPEVAKERRRGNGSPCIQPGFRRGLKPANAGKRFPADPPTPDEVMALIEACDIRGPHGRTGVRNRALIAVLWRSGLRISEALALRPHHVDFQSKTVTVLAGKGSKRRTSGIDKFGLFHLSAWLMERARLELPADAPLFCCVLPPHTGQPLGSAYVREALKDLGAKTGLSKRIAPHQLRHAHACDLAREGIGVHLVSKQLGHSNVGITSTYLAGIAPYEVVEAIAARPWPGGAR